MLGVVLCEGRRQGRGNRRTHGSCAERESRAGTLDAAGQQRTHIALVHGTEQLLTLERLAQVLQADQEHDDGQDPHDPRTQHNRHFGGIRDRQNSESRGHENT